MPQITLEHSPHFDGTDWEALSQAIHQLCIAKVGASLEACKTRILRRDTIFIADGNPAQAFVHCDLRILSGRTQAQKNALGEAVQSALLAGLFKYAGPSQISSEIGNLDSENYRKVSLPL